jgi:hypothetical protein
MTIGMIRRIRRKIGCDPSIQVRAAFAMTPGPEPDEVRSDQNKDRSGSREP